MGLEGSVGENFEPFAGYCVEAIEGRAVPEDSGAEKVDFRGECGFEIGCRVCHEELLGPGWHARDESAACGRNEEATVVETGPGKEPFGVSSETLDGCCEAVDVGEFVHWRDLGESLRYLEGIGEGAVREELHVSGGAGVMDHGEEEVHYLWIVTDFSKTDFEAGAEEDVAAGDLTRTGAS